MTQKLRARLREVTNEAILAAAESVFAQRGLHAAKMETIAAEAGVSVGTLYNHFTDREGLLAELVLARRAEMVDRLDEALHTHAREPFAAQLRAFVAALCAHMEAHRSFLSIWMECDASRDGGTALLSVKKGRPDLRPSDEIYRRVETLIERGLKSRALRADDADIYATMLQGMLKGAMLRRLFHSTRVAPLDQRVDQMTRFFLQGAGH